MIVWESGVDDGDYHVTVERAGSYRGVLIVVRTRDNATLLHRDVALSYDATFGPDVGDIADWREWAIEAIEESER